MSHFRSVTELFAEREAQKLSRPMQRMPDMMATVYMALSCIIMAYSVQFGFVSILLFYTLWLPHLRHIRPMRNTIIAIVFPLFAACSALWSDYPAKSLYYALEYSSLMLCTLIMTSRVSIPAFLRGIMIGSSLVLAATLLNGRYDGDALTGLFDSKNQVGLYAEICALFSLLVWFGKQKYRAWAIPALAIALYALIASQSASSIASLALTTAALAVFYAITLLPQHFRLLACLICTCLIMIAAVCTWSQDWHYDLLKSFGKGHTLSGRTELWEEGFALGMERPILGHGYNAFWVQGNPRAEQLWFDYHIYARNGFHFHNLYMETFVELGIAGVILIIGVFTAMLYRCISAALHFGIHLEQALPLGIALMFLIRSLVEVDVLGPFGISPILFFWALAQSVKRHPQ